MKKAMLKKRGFDKFLGSGRAKFLAFLLPVLLVLSFFPLTRSGRFRALHEGSDCGAPIELFKPLAVTIYLSGVIFMFLGIAIVCHDYFIVALQV
jgi:hypothetical protein